MSGVSIRHKTVLVVTTGGTIAMTQSEGAGLTPTLSGKRLLEQLREYVAVNIEIVSRLLVPSSALSFESIRDLAVFLDKNLVRPDLDGAVVVQGTDTIEETSYLLELLLATDKPVVVTGAMRSADALGADGPANIVASIKVASASESAGLGTLVVLNDKIHSAIRVTKANTSQLNAFCSPNGGPLGVISEGEVSYFNRIFRRKKIAVKPLSFDSPVALLKIALSDDGRTVKALPGLGYKGLVIEGMGGGHLPAAIVQCVADICRVMPVILCSRTGSGAVLTKTYSYPGSEIDLIARGVIPAQFLNGLKARILLTVYLASGLAREEIAQVFQ